MAKKEELTADEQRDKQRADDRAAELAKQAEVNDAMEAFYAEQKKEAEKALRRQEKFEATGIREVDSE